MRRSICVKTCAGGHELICFTTLGLIPYILFVLLCLFSPCLPPLGVCVSGIAYGLLSTGSDSAHHQQYMNHISSTPQPNCSASHSGTPSRLLAVPRYRREFLVSLCCPNKILFPSLSSSAPLTSTVECLKAPSFPASHLRFLLPLQPAPTDLTGVCIGTGELLPLF